ncbi:MAG TPA: hypothetical protein VLK85_09850, partial [Ramlibacter sp.]|nr:hypothetical protein [Ramlibacter sp.]
MRAHPLASRGALALALLLLVRLPLAAEPGQGPGALAAAAPAAAPVAPALPPNLPLRREGTQGETSSSWLLASGLLVVLAVGALALAGRRGGAARLLRGALRQPTGQRGIERLASQALTAQASVHAIRWQGEELLVACTPHEV